MTPAMTDLLDELTRTFVCKPRVDRAEKKRRQQIRQAARKALVRFAGQHRTRAGTPEQVKAVLWPAKIWIFDKPLHVPRSLRFALGKALSVKEPLSWKGTLRTPLWAYLTASKPQPTETEQASP